MSTKSYSIAPRQSGLRIGRDKEWKSDGSTLGSAIVVGNPPPLIGASAICGAAMGLRINSNLGAGRRKGSGSDDRRAAQKV